MLKQLKNNQGLILVIVLMIIIVMTTLTLSLISLNISQVKVSEQEVRKIQSELMDLGMLHLMFTRGQHNMMGNQMHDSFTMGSTTFDANVTMSSGSDPSFLSINSTVSF